MVRRGHIWANEYMNLTSETHNMGELFVFKPQGNGSTRGNHLAKRREVFNQYRIWYLWVHIRKYEAGGKSYKGSYYS